MLNIRIAVVENELNVAQNDIVLLERYAKENSLSLETSIFQNGYEFLDTEEEFDAVLMDIDMPGLNGMEVAEKLREKNKAIDIIFTTNLPQFAVDGYKVQALDFVIKPVTFPNLSFAMEKVVEKKRNFLNGSFFLRIGGFAKRIHNEEVLYIEMVNHYIVLHEIDMEPVRIRGSLKMIEDLLNPEIFVKINSGIVINISKVSSFENGLVLMEDGSNLPLSRSHKKEFAVRLAEFYGNSF